MGITQSTRHGVTVPGAPCDLFTDHVAGDAEVTIGKHLAVKAHGSFRLQQRD